MNFDTPDCRLKLVLRSMGVWHQCGAAAEMSGAVNVEEAGRALFEPLALVAGG